ncbi:Helix-turn-helix domain-containing protein [Amycolatopsis arida]|uniref:Helix-turn-helix domain-containing protein n=1 Tax=Amycolatopsis arida TaxID=587909 RepID=A0A1I5MDR2_9PSEU|nr:helix-turn-helix transcriptional regulator [Amycolatopsis arida]TDX94060.1 helix-turn-helix protein [Amycolatopsis arida]SFP07705.1 Helix-turn-helix domain-containing protein [Amycolatopsis arida]
MSDFEKLRMEYADELRRRRERAGLTGRDFADLLGWTNSKVSKIERGRQTPTDSDVVDWLEALDTPDDEIAEMRDRLRELRVRQLSWRRQLREGHRSRQEQDALDEQAATTIRAVEAAAVPGLLQTPDYARHIFRTQSGLLGVADDIDDAVRARMQRQSVLYAAGKTIEILMAETALHNISCPADVMVGQLDRLTAAVGLPGVRFGILPMGTELPHVLWHGYWVVDDVVFVETITDELRIRDPEQVAIYNTLTDRLWSAAVEGEAARSLLARVADQLRG